MSQHSITNFVYFTNQENKNKKPSDEVSNDTLQKILQIVARQALKEKTPSTQELERILQGVIQQSEEHQKLEKNSEGTETNIQGGGESLIKHLEKMGYLKDEKKWLTNKGFIEIGGKLLHDVMKAIKEGGVGFHEIKHVGTGSTILDTTKKFEIGDDIRFLNVPQTVLNSIQRIAKKDSIKFPIAMQLEDFEEFETIEEVKVAVVYCIDLSSTMKYSVGAGEGSRIEAADRKSVV